MGWGWGWGWVGVGGSEVKGERRDLEGDERGGTGVEDREGLGRGQLGWGELEAVN